MSYARPSTDSDVYVWGGVDKHGKPLYFCDSCMLSMEPRFFRTSSLQALWDHLKDHRRAGHLVPDHAFQLVAEDMQQEKQQEKLQRKRKLAPPRKEL